MLILDQYTARTVLILIADEYQNNYLTPDKFAEHNGLRTSEAIKLIALAQEVRSKNHPES